MALHIPPHPGSARTAELTEAEELQMCVPDAQHRDAQCPASRPRRAVCTSSGVRLKRSSALMSAPFSRSHSDTLKEPSLAARCLRACHTAGWDGAHWMHRESGVTRQVRRWAVCRTSHGTCTACSVLAGWGKLQGASDSQWRPFVIVAAGGVRNLHRRCGSVS